MINWPQHLIGELAERRCLIFLGSGVSANAKNNAGRKPKIWKDFLKDAIELVQDEKEKKFIEQLIENNNYLLALQCIYDHSDRGDYIRFLKDEFLDPRYEPARIHDYIVEIDPKIVITTNFDVIYEKASNDEGHTIVHYYDNNLIEVLRSDQRITIKAHGTIHNTQNMIFTKSEYFKAKRDYPEFYNILSALFLTNTVLFIGCSLDDPDINLILENVHNTSGDALPHYVVARDNIDNNIIKDWKQSYNIHTLKYGPGYPDLEPNLRNLRDLVLGYRESRSTS